MSDKLSFYSKDPEGAFKPEASDTSEKPYTGAERRRENRRKAIDRREDVRFDLTKDDRRKIEGRRKDDGSPKFW